MRRTTATALAVPLLLLSLPSAQGASETADGTLQIDYEPESLTLAPDETSEVHLTVKNIGDNWTYVHVEFIFQETRGHSVGIVKTSLFSLEAGKSREVVVKVTSGARFGQDAGDSDFVIRMTWGQNCTDSELQEPLGGEWSREFEVEDDFKSERMYRYVGIVVLVVVIVVILALLIVRKRGQERIGPPEEL